MLHYAVVFFVIAIIAAVLGFSGIAGTATAWRWRTLRQPAQGHQFGQVRAQAVAFGHVGGVRRGWIGHAQTQGAGTRASSSCTRRSPSQPSAVAS